MPYYRNLIRGTGQAEAGAALRLTRDDLREDLGADGGPEGKSCHGGAHDTIGKNARYLVSEALHGRRACLGLLYKPHLRPGSTPCHVMAAGDTHEAFASDVRDASRETMQAADAYHVRDGCVSPAGLGLNHDGPVHVDGPGHDLCA